MKKKLWLILFIAFALSFVMISCNPDKEYIDQSDILPKEPNYVNVPIKGHQNNFIAYHSLTRLASAWANEKDFVNWYTSGSSKAGPNNNPYNLDPYNIINDINLPDEALEIYNSLPEDKKEEKDITDKEFETIQAENVEDLSMASEIVAEEDGILSKTFVSIGKVTLDKLKGIVLGTASKYVEDFFADVFKVHYSEKSAKIDNVYAKVDSLSASIQDVIDAIQEASLKAEFNTTYNMMKDIKLQVKKLYGERGVNNGNVYRMMNDPYYLNMMKSQDGVAIQTIEQAFRGAGVDTQRLLDNVELVIERMKKDITNKNHNYYELLDYVVRKTYPWEEQGFAIREALRSSDCLALKDAITALNLYYSVTQGIWGSNTVNELNNKFAEYLQLLEDTPIDYSDYNRGYAVCNITHAYVKVKKNQEFAKNLVPITYQLYFVFHYHVNSAYGPGSNQNWNWSVPDEFEDGASVSKNPGYLYNFKIDLVSKNPDVFKQQYIDKMKNLQDGCPAIYKLCADKAEEVAGKLKKQEYFTLEVIEAISKYYDKIAVANKHIILDGNKKNDQAVKDAAEKIKNNNFLYAMIDGGIYDADDVAEWYAGTTKDALKASGITDTQGNVFISYNFDYRKPQHDVALLYKEGNLYYRRDGYHKNVDLIWYSMFRTSDNKLFKEFNQQTENASLTDRENLISETCNISRGDYVSALNYNIWRQYFHPIITYETYEIKGDLQ